PYVRGRSECRSSFIIDGPADQRWSASAWASTAAHPRHPPPLIPLGHPEIPARVIHDPMWRIEQILPPFLGRDPIRLGFLRVVIGPNGGFDLSVQIEDGHASPELRNGELILEYGQAAGPAQPFGEDPQDLAVEIHLDQAVVKSVGTDEPCGL